MNETKRKPDKGMTWITLLKKKYIWIPLAAVLLLSSCTYENERSKSLLLNFNI